MNLQIKHIAILCLFSGIFLSCKNDETFDYEEFPLDMVTCLINNNSVYFQLDNGSYLIPDNTITPEGIKNMQRVMLNYVIKEKRITDKEYIIKVRSIGQVLYKGILNISAEDAPTIKDDSIYLNSIWYGGECINLRYKIEFNNIPHSLEMIYIPEKQLPDDTLRLQLRHDKNNDPAGFLTAGYASFRISPLLIRQNLTTIKIYVNCYNIKEKNFTLNLK